MELQEKMMRRCINARASVADLPEEIMVEILRRLPIKGIVMCKLTCKRWYYLISSNYFAKVHFAHARSSILVDNVNPRQYARTKLYMIEAREINPKCCSCDGIIESGDHDQINIKLDTEMKIPVIIKDEEREKYADAKSECLITRWRSFKYVFAVMNSCNGFICLADNGENCNPVVVCNPVTNEYVELPETSNVEQMFGGLGFCEETNEYKVIRVRKSTDNMAEMHTLGTKSWRSIGVRAPFFQWGTRNPIHLNGVLYWISDEPSVSCLLSFDFRNECFGAAFPSPPICPQQSARFKKQLGIIANRICLFVDTARGLTDIWKMEEELSSDRIIWSKLMSVDSPTMLHFRELGSISCSKCLASALPILYHLDKKVMKCYDAEKKEWKKLIFKGKGFLPYMIIHTPTFFSLKHFTGGANNIKPISTRFKLREGTLSFLKGMNEAKY